MRKTQSSKMYVKSVSTYHYDKITISQSGSTLTK